MKQRLLGAAGILMIVLMSGITLVESACAQSNEATPVRNIDEKGRAPYMQSVAHACNREKTCDVTFPSIPEGKRLVIERVNGVVSLPSGGFRHPLGGLRFTSLLAPHDVQFVLPAHTVADPTLLIVNESVLAYFEAGEAPIFRANMSAEFESVFVVATLSGYLVDLAQ